MTEQEIEENKVFMFVRGSHAYGLNNADSDEDLGGIALPSRDVVLGFDEFKQKDDYVDATGTKTDTSVYNILKALDLIANNNPNMLDFLYAPDRCIRLLKPEWEHIMEYRDQFLCKKAKWAYQGYATDQLNRLETHRSYLLHPMTQPTREAFNLPAKSIFPENQLAVIARLSSEYVPEDKQNMFYKDMSALFDHEGAMTFKKYVSHDMCPFAIADFKRRDDEFLRMIGSVSQHFLKDEYRNMAHQELKYLAACDQWVAYKRWQKQRNPKRKLLEEKCGYDAKHAAHLIRLLRMGCEIMQGKGVNVDRTNIDREHLYKIRIGDVKFDDMMAECKELNDVIDDAYSNNNILPLEQNTELFTRLKREIIEQALTKR